MQPSTRFRLLGMSSRSNPNTYSHCTQPYPSLELFWRHYDDFHFTRLADGAAMPFGAHFAQQVLSGIGSVAIALLVLEWL